jgi:hypothetical protein
MQASDRGDFQKSCNGRRLSERRVKRKRTLHREQQVRATGMVSTEPYLGSQKTYSPGCKKGRSDMGSYADVTAGIRRAVLVSRSGCLLGGFWSRVPVSVPVMLNPLPKRRVMAYMRRLLSRMSRPPRAEGDDQRLVKHGEGDPRAFRLSEKVEDLRRLQAAQLRRLQASPSARM